MFHHVSLSPPKRLVTDHKGRGNNRAVYKCSDPECNVRISIRTRNKQTGVYWEFYDRKDLVEVWEHDIFLCSFNAYLRGEGPYNSDVVNTIKVAFPTPLRAEW
jgi:hypothetical protein